MTSSDFFMAGLGWLAATGYIVNEAYKWGFSVGREQTEKSMNRTMFAAVRAACDDPRATSERRSGAYEVVRQVVRR